MIDDRTLMDIFEMDPLKLTATSPEIEALVEDNRQKRHLFNLGAMRAGSTKKVAEGIKLDLTKMGLKK